MNLTQSLIGNKVFSNTSTTFTPSNLKSLGIDTNKINEEVSNKIQETKSKTLSKEKVKEIIANKPSTISNQEIIQGLLDRGYTLEGFDVDRFNASKKYSTPKYDTAQSLQDISTEDTTEDATEEKKSAVGELASSIAEVAPSATISTLKGGKNLVGSFVSQFPEIAGNTFGFLADVVTPKQLEGLGDVFREQGIKDKESMQEKLGVDPDSFATQAGEIGAEISSIFIPTGAAGLSAKIGEKAPLVVKGLETLKTTAPKLYEGIKLAVTGGVEAAKFDVASEGEISPTSVTVGAVSNPVLNELGKVVKGFVQGDAVSNFMKAINPSKIKNVVKGKQAATAKEDATIILGAIKSSGEKPSNLEEARNFMSNRLDTLYSETITPAIEKSKAIFKVGDLVDDAYKKVFGTSEIGGVSEAKLFNKTKELDTLNSMAEEWKKIGNQASATTTEGLKQKTAAIVRANGVTKELSSMEEEFFKHINEGLAKQLDDNLTTSLGKGGATKIKREYAAFSNRLADVDAQILREAKKRGVGLFDGLGIVSGLRDIASGNIKSGVTSVITGKILNILREPDELLKKAVEQVYKTSGSTPSKVIGVGSSLAGQKADEIVNE